MLTFWIIEKVSMVPSGIILNGFILGLTWTYRRPYARTRWHLWDSNPWLLDLWILEAWPLLTVPLGRHGTRWKKYCWNPLDYWQKYRLDYRHRYGQGYGWQWWKLYVCNKYPSIMYESQLQHFLKYVITDVHKVSINMIMYVYDDEYYNLFYAIIVSNAKT